MTEDVALYVELAREADGPIVELGGRDRPGRDPDRARDRQARDRHRPLAGDARSRARARRRTSRRVPRWRHARLRRSRSRPTLVICPGRSLLHLPRLARQAPRLRARRADAAARRPLRVERVRLQPRRSPRSIDGQTQTATASSTRCTYAVRPTTGSTSRRDGGAATLRPLVGDEVRMGRASSTSPGSRSRRCTAGSTGAVRRTTPTSSSGSPRKPA